MNNKKRLFKRPSLLSFVFLFFVISTSFLVIGYSANSSTLAIDGSLVTRSNLDVRITDIKLNSSGLQLASQTVTPGYTAKSVDGGVRLTGSSSYVKYDVTVTNLSSQNVLVTDIASTQWTNPNMEYVLENLTINETIIPAASEYTFQVKIKFKDGIISKILGLAETIIENVLGISLNLNMVLNFTFYKVPQYSLEITSNPEDAIITYTVNGEVVATCTGYCRKVFDVNTKVTWKVQKEGLTAKTNTVTMDKNYSKTVDISGFIGEITYKFTLVPNPQSAAVNLKCGDTEVNGFGTQSCEVEENTAIEYSVTKAGYYDKSGSYTIETSDYTLNVTLEEKPWITGTYLNTSSTLAATESLTVYHSGKYLIDIWGGKGADKYSVDLTSSGYGGAAGHVYGVVELYEGQTVYYTLGGNAQTSVLGGLLGTIISTSESGVNGGGKAKSASLGAGGGYSAFALDTTVISESTINSGNVLFIAAGGGGGGGSYSSKTDTFACGDGGAGGNMSSTKTAVSTIGYAFSGENGTVPSAGNSTYIGGGGSSTAGVCSSRSNNNGSLLSGGQSYEKGGAGGAGYYGGAGGRGTGRNQSGKYSAGGGGGSSFISSLATFEGLDSSVTSKVSTSNPSTTGGSLIITYIGS